MLDILCQDKHLLRHDTVSMANATTMVEQHVPDCLKTDVWFNDDRRGMHMMTEVNHFMINCATLVVETIH